MASVMLLGALVALGAVSSYLAVELAVAAPAAALAQDLLVQLQVVDEFAPGALRLEHADLAAVASAAKLLRQIEPPAFTDLTPARRIVQERFVKSAPCAAACSTRPGSS
jgi:hypothetical protein